MIDFTMDLSNTDLAAMKTVELRKLAAQGGLKGQSSARKEHLLGLLEPIKLHQIEVKAEMEREYAATAAQIKADTAALDAKPAKSVKVSKTGRKVTYGINRTGMVIVAKGTEYHKSETFKAEAEKAGWTVTIEHIATDEIDEETGEPIIRYHAVAKKVGAMVEGSWIGKAWDYPNAGAGIGGKARKVRNLKEAIRILHNWM